MFFDPKIRSFFKAIPPSVLNNQWYGLKHPGAIFNLSVNELIQAINGLVQELSNEKHDGIIHYLNLSVSRFFQFYDACFEIMLPFCRQHPLPKEGEFLHLWLKNNKYQMGEEFYSRTSSKVVTLNKLYNKLKHSGNHIRLMQFYNGRYTNFCYYMEGVKPLTPISVSRQVKELHYLIYFVSSKLLFVLQKELETRLGASFTYKRVGDDGELFNMLYQTVYSLNRFYLLSEIGGLIYESYTDDLQVKFAECFITDTLFDLYYRNGIHFNAIIVSDGFHNSFHIPSCGMNSDGDLMHSPEFYYRRKNGEKELIRMIPPKK